MGVSITATNSKYDFDMGYGGFFSLRTNIALALDEEFGENYARLGRCHTKAQFAENDKAAERIIGSKHLDDAFGDVLDFLYLPDTGGRISYKTCGKIYGLIKDIDFGGDGFRYQFCRGGDYEEFKEFLKECYSHRRMMRWY